MPPTQQPPVPEVTAGPFTQFLGPELNQQGLVQQSEQGQGRQFSGREGTVGKTAGLLTRFLEGWSTGRAKAESQKAIEEAKKQTGDAQQLNNYIQAAAASGKDPELVQQLQQEALRMQGHWATKVLGEAGKTNPILGALHTVATTMLGGPPPDESTKIDPKTGKKQKVKTTYEGPDPEKINDLWNRLAAAPKMEEAATQKAGLLTDQAKSLIQKAQESHPNTPVTEEEARGILATSGLDTKNQLLFRTYGVDALGGVYAGFRKAPTYEQEQKIRDEQLFSSTFGPAQGQTAAAPGQQQPQARTQPPPESQFYVGGIQGGKVPQQTLVPEAKGGQPVNQALNQAQQGDRTYNREALFKLYQDKKIDREEIFVTNSPGSANGKEMTAYFTPKGYITEDGKLIPPELIASKTANAGAAWSEKEDQDPKYGHVTYLFNNKTGTYKIATTTNENGEEVPRRRYYAGTDAQTRYNRIQDKLADRTFVVENTRDREITALEKEANQKDPITGDPKLTPEQFQARRKAIYDRAEQLKRNIQERGVNLTRMTQSEEDRKAIPIAPATSSIAAKNNSPFNLKIGNKEFMTFKDPKEGVKAGLDLLDKYFSDKGFLKVNGNSTLYEMMQQWAPLGDGNNDPELYAEAIANALKLPNGIATQVKDLRDKKYDVARAMFEVEGSRQFIPVLDEMMGKKSIAKTAEPPKGGGGGKAVVSFDEFMK